jgi:hypothetical protein
MRAPIRTATAILISLISYTLADAQVAPPALPPAPAAPAVLPATTRPAEPPQKVAASRIVAATVYQGTALVTREVDVPEGQNLVEFVVSPLPEQTVDSSLYTEGTDGIRVLSTRFRARAVQEDTRDEVRAVEQKIRELTQANELIQRETQISEQNLQLLSKLENFTAATMQQLMDKGMLNGDATIGLTKFLMDTRTKLAEGQVKAKHQTEENGRAIEFAQRQMNELTAGANRTLRDAVITVDKGANNAAAKVRLNYLVNAAEWSPQYKLRAGKETDPVQVEYLAAIQQQSGEDWSGVEVTLSTAEPMLNAAPPELLALNVDVTPVRPVATAAPGSGGPKNQPGSFGGVANVRENYMRAKQLRQEAQQALNANQIDAGWSTNNSAAALEQTNELLGMDEDAGVADLQKEARASREGPSVTYHLKAHLTVPSRNDQQLIEVARLELKPEYFYKVVPVLSQHVYRLAKLTNTSTQVLLPGEATMYQGTDFVGRTNLPLVAIGEQFTAGFGVDPQLQASRELVDKSRSVQGGNQVHAYHYRVRLSSFKQTPVTVQVWDRLPRAEAAESVGVNLVSTQPELSRDERYLRAERPQNLLRWDVKVEPGENGEKAKTITYDFKLEYDRNVAIANFKTTK